MEKTFLILSFALCFVYASVGQLPATGDGTWRDRVYQAITPSGDTYGVHLKDLRGKLTILEFWNSSCSSCLTGMPKLYELREQYKDQVHILPVTSDGLQQVTQTFDRLKGGKYEFRLPTIYGDSLFAETFKVRGVPYVVWLDEEGEFLASTGSEVVNTKVLDEVLRGNKGILSRYAISDRNSLGNLSHGKTADDSLLNRNLLSVRISPYDRSVRSLRDTGSSAVGRSVYRLSNKSVYQLVKTNLSLPHDTLIHEFYADTKNKRMIVSERIRRRYKDVWELGAISDFDSMSVARDQNLFCLTIDSDRDIPLQARKSMIHAALEAYFGFEVKVERREVGILKIVGAPLYVTDEMRVDDPFKESHVQSMGHLLRILNDYYPQTPIVQLGHEALHTRQVSIVHHRDTPCRQFYETLEGLGIKFEPAKTEMEVIVIE